MLFRSKPVTKHYHEMVYLDESTRTVKQDENGLPIYEQVTRVYNNPVFSFMNIIAPPAEVFDEYWAVHAKTKSDTPISDPNWWGDVMKAASVSNHWYDWNNREWGTKWDIAVPDDEKYADTVMERYDNGDVTYRFQTAWSPVIELLVNVMSPMFPNLTFAYDYEEEQGWGGEVTFRNGEVLQSSEYDIPQSHADHLAQDKECPCEYGDLEFAYSDCPVDTNLYFYDAENYGWYEKTLDKDPSDVVS